MVTQKSSLDGVPPQSQAYKGSGPNGWCIKPCVSGEAPAVLKPFACSPLAHLASRPFWPSSSFRLCAGLAPRLCERWTRVADTCAAQP